MKTTSFALIFIATILMLSSVVSAVPTMSAIALGDITSNVVTFHATGGTSPCWFSWGYGSNRYWTTPNQTINGDFTDTQTGSPMLTGETYTVTACDSTGCDPTPESFAVPKARMINATHYGSAVITIMRSGFDIGVVAPIIIMPYAAIMSSSSTVVSTGAASVVWGLFFTFVFAGYWLRGRGIMLPAILAIMSGTLLIGTSAVGSPIAIAPIFASMGLPLLIIGIAGVATSWFSNK